MNAELDVLHLLLSASIPVQIVMAILLGFSIASWFIIFRKKAMIDRANRDAGEFEDRFWSGADLAGLFKEVTADGERITGTASIFEAGLSEVFRSVYR